MNPTKLTTIDEYIASFPKEVQERLQQVRATIKAAAPAARETIKYAMPTFTLNGNLVYFAAFKNHIGFYALPTANQTFRAELSAYKTGKGSIQFPHDQPLPLPLISNLVRFRVAQNLAKAEKKRSGKKGS